MPFQYPGKLILHFLNFVNNVITSFGKFGKSSYLSLLFLGIILLMVQALEQANTLLVDMIESDKTSLLLCFVVISVFASVLSHYPRYIYYAENINDSRDDHKWYIYKWLGYAIFIFSKIDPKYKQDFKAKFFRHCLGLVIFIIWHYYIYQTFYPKLYFSGFDISLIQAVTLLLSVIPAAILIFLLDTFDKYQDQLLIVKGDEATNAIKAKKKQFVTKGVNALFMCIGLVLVLGCIIAFTLNFSIYGYWLLQVFTFVLALLYILFRVFRVYAKTVNFNRYYFLSSSVGYLRYYFVFFVIVILFLVYSNIAVFYNWKLSNAMLILLCYFFITYYALACLVKYFFMITIFRTQKEDLDKNPYVTEKNYLYSSGVLPENRHHLVSLDDQNMFSVRRRLIASIVTLVIVIISIVSYTSETQIHELQAFQNIENEEVLYMDAFKDSLRSRTDKPLFFVAAHGGGLKANIWTMKVLNEIQMQTEGEFLDQTVSFSGASGGMMGVSLYSVLGGEYTDDFTTIGLKIDQVANQNFASKDLALTFGYDFIRKLYPLSSIGKYRDRSYYSMVTYRNILEDQSVMTLDSLSFNSYWKTNIFNNKRGYFPSLIVNTAKTNGRRGVFYSVKYPQDSTLFYNSDNLSQLRNGRSIAYYEAVSSTNRFPALSPAAKIKGYGHYIDAGALDNSGLLSSMDLHNYLLKDSTLNKTKKIFVEIINGRNNYIWHLVQKFKDENDITHLKIDEVEQDNIVADLKTGFNLDKIPNYLSDFMQDWSKDPLVDYIPIHLPFQIEFDEVQSFLGGDLIDKNQILAFEQFLKQENAKVKAQIKDNATIWKTYEPTLARHLSKSTIAYYDRVIQSELIKEQINAIHTALED
ncbi:hypothetical protein [Psychroserpens sp. SPM9]|uniref:hypothetical protein n=1 Tax=Psychroserpens sp. SPM9 TaxID=2975598 RepID=UPI0021A3D5FE|nr:hypothetical protein [Psychroserpens sp. SPM9]MDG5491806.1 hypothetical protein [Psychroserpens sp. SPM9]